MWSENPDLTTSFRPAFPRLAPAGLPSLGIVDALGRAPGLSAGEAAYGKGHGRVLTPSRGSHGLFILAP
jgi:hypothetical protein